MVLTILTYFINLFYQLFQNMLLKLATMMVFIFKKDGKEIQKNAYECFLKNVQHGLQS